MVFGQNDKDVHTLRRAATALVNFTEKKESDKNSKLLVAMTAPISVQIALRKVPEKGTPKPLLVVLPHTLRNVESEDGVEMCLFIKDEDKDAVKGYLKKHPIPGLTKVMTLTKLRLNFGRYEDKRTLCASFDLFLTDARIVNFLAKPLGKNFFAKKKQPVPIKVKKDNLPALAKAVERAQNSTCMFISQGPCVSVRMADTGMPMDSIVENLTVGIQNAVQRLPRKWKNVQSLHIKTHDSIALPVYNSLPSTEFKIADRAASAVEKVAEKLQQENVALTDLEDAADKNVNTADEKVDTVEEKVVQKDTKAQVASTKKRKAKNKKSSAAKKLK